MKSHLTESTRSFLLDSPMLFKATSTSFCPGRQFTQLFKEWDTALATCNTQGTVTLRGLSAHEQEAQLYSTATSNSCILTLTGTFLQFSQFIALQSWFRLIPGIGWCWQGSPMTAPAVVIKAAALQIRASPGVIYKLITEIHCMPLFRKNWLKQKDLHRKWFTMQANSRTFQIS